ncbi:MAG: hydroxymethylglutaryl-CoA lyase [Pseudomonadota bacterium]
MSATQNDQMSGSSQGNGATKPAVDIVEVAPRDGFQVVKPFIETDLKIRIIEALAASGLKRMEIGAFVSPKAIPQMADITEIMQRVTLPAGLRTAVLVPNRKGLEMAVEAGVKDIHWVVSVSESHNQNNVRRSVNESLQELRAAWEGVQRDDVRVRFNLATAFDCPFEGRTDESAVFACLDAALAFLPPGEIGIADTTGRAATDHVRSLFTSLQERYGPQGVTFAFHGHDTYNLGVANALAAYDAGIRSFDGAAAGLGGCPFAPGASGNTATEDLVFAFEHMGVSTGIDLEALLNAADLAMTVAPELAAGRIRQVPRARALSGFGAASQGIAA